VYDEFHSKDLQISEVWPASTVPQSCCKLMSMQ